MSATRTPPTEDPNYYRILYQLAAQNLSAATDGGSQSELQRAGLLREAADHADKLRRLARHQLAVIAARPRSVSHPRRGISARQGRLQEFLAASVLPCADLVVASVRVLGQGDPDAGEGELTDVRRRVARPARAVAQRWWHGDGKVARKRAEERAEGLSSRAYYSLACYEGRRAAVGASSALDDAFAALEESLRRSDGTRRAELGRWSQDDPALHELVHGKRYQLQVAALLDAYAIPVAPRSPQPARVTARG